MINRQTIYSALFKLKNAGVDITPQLKIMEEESGIPRKIIEFLRDNSPQFQFYRYIQKYQKGLAKSILNYDDLSREEKIVACSSFISRAYLSVMHKNLDESLLEDLNIDEMFKAGYSATRGDFSNLDKVMHAQQDTLKQFYLNNHDFISE